MITITSHEQAVTCLLRVYSIYATHEHWWEVCRSVTQANGVGSSDQQPDAVADDSDETNASDDTIVPPLISTSGSDDEDVLPLRQTKM